MTLKKLRLPALATAVVMLAACAGPLQKVDATADRMSKVETITIIRQPQELRYAVVNDTPIASTFGLIGALLVENDRSAKEAELASVLQPLGVKVNATLVDEVATRLTAEGYKTIIVDAPPVKLDMTTKAGYDRLVADSDAILVLLTELVGFVSKPNETFYSPTMRVYADLVTRDRQTSLYRQAHSTGTGTRGDIDVAHSVQTVQFPNFPDLTKDPRVTADALLAMTRVIADSIAAGIPDRMPGGAGAAMPAPALTPAAATNPDGGSKAKTPASRAATAAAPKAAPKAVPKPATAPAQ